MTQSSTGSETSSLQFDDRWINEDKHREGKPHLKKLWGMVLCRLCTGESSNGRKLDSDSINEGSIPSLPANCKHYKGTHFYDNPHRYMCVNCGKEIVDCGRGYEEAK